MAQQVFRTKEGTGPVEISTVGVLSADGGSVIPVQLAAERGMSELQKKDEYGALELNDQGNPIPLTGTALKDAAKAFAEKYDLEVVSMSDDNVQELSGELPAPVALAEYEHERVFGSTAPVVADGEVIADASVAGPVVTEEGE